MDDWAPPTLNLTVKKLLLVGANNNLQCCCKLPMVFTNPKRMSVKCPKVKGCGLMISLAPLKAMKEANVFKDWPKVTLPYCTACNKGSLTLFKIKDLDNHKYPTVKCSCAGWQAFNPQNCPEGFDPTYWSHEPVYVAGGPEEEKIEFNDHF